jgi:hypothetical protein
VIYYISAFIIYGLAVIYLLQEGRRRRGLVFISGMSPLVLLALLRGGVGTDTASYLSIVDEIENYGSTSVPVENGFVLLIKAMLYLGAEPMQVLVLVGLITTVVFISASLSSGRAMLVSAICIVPIFYLDMTMNGLRYGLSFAFAMYAIALFSQNRVVVGFFLAACSVLFHISGLAIFVIMALLASNKIELRRWVALSVGLALVVLVQLHGSQQNEAAQPTEIAQQTEPAQRTEISFAEKVMGYIHSPPPSILSGLAPLVLSIVVIFLIVSVDQMGDGIRSRRFYIVSALVIGTFIVAKFSYAGLRLQFLVLFAMLVALQFKPEFAAASIQSKGVRRSMIIVGVLGGVAFLKNIYITQGVGATPFLPYSINPSVYDIWPQALMR